MDAAVLRAEKEQWAVSVTSGPARKKLTEQSTEARLQADFRSVQSERAKLQQLIENYTNISAEAERSRGNERAKLEKRIDELTRET
jgi:nucleoprotein TPR